MLVLLPLRLHSSCSAKEFARFTDASPSARATSHRGKRRVPWQRDASHRRPATLDAVPPASRPLAVCLAPQLPDCGFHGGRPGMARIALWGVAWRSVAW